jgi:hypothetical protein
LNRYIKQELSNNAFSTAFYMAKFGNVVVQNISQKKFPSAFLEVPYLEWGYLNADYESLSYRKSIRNMEYIRVWKISCMVSHKLGFKADQCF